MDRPTTASEGANVQMVAPTGSTTRGVESGDDEEAASQPKPLFAIGQATTGFAAPDASINGMDRTDDSNAGSSHSSVARGATISNTGATKCVCGYAEV